MMDIKSLKAFTASAMISVTVIQGASLAEAQDAEDPTLLSSLGTTVTVAYNTQYVLYGYRLGRHLFMADVYCWLPVNEKLSTWFGGWYGYLPDGTYHELDLYGGVDYVLTGQLSAGLAYSIFNYLEVPFETSAQAHEFAMHLTYKAGPVVLQVRDQYDTEAQGHLIRGMATVGRAVTKRVAVEMNAEYGYAVDYFIDGDDPNHALFAIRCIYLANALRVSPFVAYTIPLDAIEAFEEEDFYGGISFSWSF